MTNAQIIFNESLDLMNDGIIGTTGRKITISYEKDGEQVTETVNEPEAIHTYKEWQNLGMQVQKGQKAIAKFTIWMYASKTKTYSKEEADKINAASTAIMRGLEAEVKEGDETQCQGHYYMKEAAFFSASQVAPAEVKTA